ncbi:hypothetical protein FB107DRAFT_280232 [Schizophyllum commune]
MRLDQQQRPELCRGAVDFEVGREYWAKGAPKVVDELWAVHEGEYAGLQSPEPTAPEPASHTRSGSLFGGESKEHPGLPPVRQPQPLSYVFALDVSREAVQSGFLRASCEALRGVLFGEGGDPWADDPNDPSASFAGLSLDPTASSSSTTGAGHSSPNSGLPPAPCLPPVFPPNSRLCLLTFDRAVHFYDFRADPGTG